MSELSKPLPLVFEPPKGRGKPPKHLADQVGNHYFSRHTRDAAAMTDLPANTRQELINTLLPELLSTVRVMEADKGTTRKTLWRLFDGSLVESVLMR